MDDWKRINIDKTQKPQRSIDEEKERARRLAEERQRWMQDSRYKYDAPKKQGNFTPADKERPIVSERKTDKTSEKKEKSKKRTDEPVRNKKSKKKPKKTSKKEKVDYRSKDERRRDYAEVARKRRKKNIVKWLIFTVLIATGVLVALSLTVLFKIETVTVTGETRYSAEQVIEASGVEIGDNLWRTTSEKLTKSTAVALPYVKSVKVSKVIPSGIQIEVTETTAVYSTEKNKKYVLIDGTDKVLEDSATKKGDTVLIKGLELLNTKPGTTFTVKSADSLNIAKEIVADAEEIGLNLTEIDVSQANRLTAVYKGRIRLEFGSRSEMAEKLKMAREIIKKLETEGNKNEGTINLKSVSKSFFVEEPLN